MRDRLPQKSARPSFVHDLPATLRYFAPVIVAATAILSAIAVELILSVILGLGSLPYWLMKHETVALCLALMQLACFFFSSALAVAALSRALLHRDRFPLRWPAEHLVHCAILYGIVAMAVVGQVNCADNCEGLILGAIKFWGLLAAGGIAANLWTLRRAAIANPAF